MPLAVYGILDVAGVTLADEITSIIPDNVYSTKPESPEIQIGMSKSSLGITAPGAKVTVAITLLPLCAKVTPATCEGPDV